MNISTTNPVIKNSNTTSEKFHDVNKKPVIKNDVTLQKKRRKKRTYWYWNTLLSAGADIFLVNQASKNNDIMGQRFGTQDIVTNIGIAEESVRNPKVTINQFMELVKETTCFALPLTILTPLVINQVSKWSNLPQTPLNNHHLDISVAVGTAFPLVISEAIGHFLNKAEPKQKLTQEELNKQEKEVKKIYAAATIAGLIKSGLLITSILKNPPKHGNKRIANAMTAATLFNTLKTIWTTYRAHSNGKEVRDSKSVSPVFFDGVVSQITAYGGEWLHQTLRIPNNPFIIAGESVGLGLLSYAGIDYVKNTLDPALNWALGIKPTSKNTSNKISVYKTPSSLPNKKVDE